MNILWLQILLGGVVLLLPGMTYLIWVERPRWDMTVHLADAIGLSVAITAIGGLVCFLLGINPGVVGIVAYLLPCLVLLEAGFTLYSKSSVKSLLDRSAFGQGLLVFIAMAALIAFKLYQARNLALPNWVDSVHHSLVVRLIQETGGLPATFQPYLNAPFAYHYGFHLEAALFSVFTFLEPEQGVLVLGQIFIGLISLALYRFGRSMGMDWKAAGLAGLLSGFVLQLPAYYVTWGRSTLAAGLFMLLLAMAAALDYRKDPANWRLGLRLALLTCGVCLTHTMATVMLALFLAVLGLMGVVKAAARSEASHIPWRLALWSIAGGLAALPWLLRILDVFRAQATIGGLVTTAQENEWGYLFNLVGPGYNHILMAMGAVGLVFALRKPRWLAFNLWSLLLVFLAQPYSLRLGPFRPDLFAIVLFIPVALALAELLGDGCKALSQKMQKRWPEWAGLALLSVLLLVWGVRETRDVINPSTVIATAADKAALDWVRENTPPEARFYANPTLWMGEMYRGVDGGYWLPAYTGRYSLVPVVFYTSQPPDEYEQTKKMLNTAAQLRSCTPEFWRVVSQAELDYVYVREGKGSLQPAALDECPRLDLVYREQGVSIYQITTVP